MAPEPRPYTVEEHYGFAVRDPDAEGSARTHFSSEAPGMLIEESLKLAGEMKPA